MSDPLIHQRGGSILVAGEIKSMERKSENISNATKLQVGVDSQSRKGSSCPLFSALATMTDLIFFGGGEGNIHAATTDGVLVWSAGTNGLVAGGPAISHNTIYYTSYDGFLYAATLDGL